MQTLGLTPAPREEGKLKSLFWPSIETGTDVDSIGTQGFWVCELVAVFSFLFMIATGHPVIGFFYFLYFFLGGVGVRERSIYAAITVFFLYFLETLLSIIMLISPGGMLRIVFCGLLLSNVRATRMAANWNKQSEQASLPPRLNETWNDKFSDQMPQWLWPKFKIVYYIFSVLMLLLAGVGVAVILVKAIR